MSVAGALAPLPGLQPSPGKASRSGFLVPVMLALSGWGFCLPREGAGCAGGCARSGSKQMGVGKEPHVSRRANDLGCGGCGDWGGHRPLPCTSWCWMPAWWQWDPRSWGALSTPHHGVCPLPPCLALLLTAPGGIGPAHFFLATSCTRVRGCHSAEGVLPHQGSGDKQQAQQDGSEPLPGRLGLE